MIRGLFGGVRDNTKRRLSDRRHASWWLEEVFVEPVQLAPPAFSRIQTFAIGVALAVVSAVAGRAALSLHAETHIDEVHRLRLSAAPCSFRGDEVNAGCESDIGGVGTQFPLSTLVRPKRADGDCGFYHGQSIARAEV